MLLCISRYLFAQCTPWPKCFSPREMGMSSCPNIIVNTTDLNPSFFMTPQLHSNGSNTQFYHFHYCIGKKSTICWLDDKGVGPYRYSPQMDDHIIMFLFKEGGGLSAALGRSQARCPQKCRTTRMCTPWILDSSPWEHHTKEVNISPAA